MLSRGHKLFCHLFFFFFFFFWGGGERERERERERGGNRKKCPVRLKGAGGPKNFVDSNENVPTPPPLPPPDNK